MNAKLKFMAHTATSKQYYYLLVETNLVINLSKLKKNDSC